MGTHGVKAGKKFEMTVGGREGKHALGIDFAACAGLQ